MQLTKKFLNTRSKMKLEKLTEEQIAKMDEVKRYWLNYIFSCKNSLDREKAKISIDWLYKLAGRKEPIVIFVDSPMACQYAVVYLKELVKLCPQLFGGDQVGDQVWAQVGDQVRDQVRAQVRAQVWAQVRDQVWAQVGAQVRDQVWDQVGAQVWAQVGDQVGDQVWAQVRDQGIEFQSFGSYPSVGDYGWVSFFDFFTQIGVINHKGFNEFKEIFSSGIYDTIQLNGFCIVSNMPSKIVRNNSGRLHNPTGPAVEFPDGYKQYYVNGRALPAWIWEKAEAGEITKEMFLKEQNSEIKGGIYEVLGQKRMMDLLGAKEIDKKQIVHANGDVETVALLKTREKFREIGNQPFAWVKMVCPSTGTQYLQGVEPHHTNALEAIASLSPFKAEEYSFDLRS